MKIETVVVLGASPKEDRYSYRAMNDLICGGYNVIPVTPKGGEILGLKCVASVADVEVPVDTLTMYVGTARSALMIEDIVKLKPGRIIFNPGAENVELAQKARAAGIETLEACTLVLLRTGQF